jgi:hypothetical protein
MSDGPNFHIMTTAATALSNEFVDVKRSICSLEILNFYPSKPWERGMNYHSQEDEIDKEAVYTAGRQCLKEIDELFLRKNIDTIDKLAMKTLRYELTRFILNKDEMPSFREF